MRVYIFVLDEHRKRSHIMVNVEDDAAIEELAILVEQLREENPQWSIFIGGDPEPPPPGWRKSRGHFYWCPYCRAERKFVFSISLQIYRCQVCGMSERDWYVRHYNSEQIRTPGPSLQTLRRRKRKKLK